MRALRLLMLASLLVMNTAIPAMANEIGLSGRSGGRGVADKLKEKEPPPPQYTLPATPYRPGVPQPRPGFSPPPVNAAIPTYNRPAVNPGTAFSAPRFSQTVNGPNGMRIVGSDTMPPSPSAPMARPMNTPATGMPPAVKPTIATGATANKSVGTIEEMEAVTEIGFNPKARRDANGNIIEDKPVVSAPTAPTLRSDRSLGGDMSRLREKQAAKAAANSKAPEDDEMSDEMLARKLREALEKRDGDDTKLIKPGATISSGRNRNF
jgi:hypothetical protein